MKTFTLNGYTFEQTKAGQYTNIPCPFCKNRSAVCCPIVDERYALTDVECTFKGCEAIGPDRKTQKEAIVAWMAAVPLKEDTENTNPES